MSHPAKPQRSRLESVIEASLPVVIPMMALGLAYIATGCTRWESYQGSMSSKCMWTLLLGVACLVVPAIGTHYTLLLGDRLGLTKGRN